MNKNISKKVLTLSTSYDPPKGGVAQVVNSYSRIFPVFNHIATHRSGVSSFHKVVIFIFSVFKFLFYCCTRNIDIVHIHGASYGSFYRKSVFILLAKAFGKKVVYHVHGAEFRLFFNKNRRIVSWIFSKVDVVIALSEYWSAFFKKELNHNQVHIIKNVVNPPVRVPIINDDLIHFLFLGEIGQRKGIYDILHALAQNIEKVNGKIRLHVGGGGDVDKLTRLIHELNLDEIVVYEGWVSGEEKNRLLSLADAFVLPSFNEGLPISILEAMTYQLPIITTPVGGIPEVVEDNVNGLLVDPGDVLSIGEAILRVVNDKEFRDSSGKISFNKVQEYYPDKVDKALESVYSDLMG